MTTFFNIKRNSHDPIEKYIAKLFGNSLYGKFGQTVKEARRIINIGEAELLGERGLAKRVGASSMLESLNKLNESLYEFTFKQGE